MGESFDEQNKQREAERAARRAAKTYTPREWDATRFLHDSWNDHVVVMQAAWIEWRHGKGAESAMQWIENTLEGPGLIPHEDDPWATDAQAFYDFNKSDVFPDCPCGRPSNTLSAGRAYCSWDHMKKYAPGAPDA